MIKSPACHIALTLVLVCASSPLLSCKSTAANSSSAKSALVATGTRTFWRQVWANGIELAIPPAKNLPAVARNMEGLWYCRAAKCGQGQVGLTNGTVVMSLQQATVAADNSLSFDINGPNSYAYNDGNDKFDDEIEDGELNKDAGRQFYKMVFENDMKGYLIRTVLKRNATPTDPVRTSGGPMDPLNSYGFEYVEDGKWLRTTVLNGKKKDDYDLLQLVDRDGKRNAKWYGVFLQDIAAAAKDRRSPYKEEARKLFVAIPEDSPIGQKGPIPPEGSRLVPETADEATESTAVGRDAADGQPRDAGADQSPSSEREAAPKKGK